MPLWRDFFRFTTWLVCLTAGSLFEAWIGLRAAGIEYNTAAAALITILSAIREQGGK